MRASLFTWSSPTLSCAVLVTLLCRLCGHGGQTTRTEEQPAPDMDFLAYFKVGMFLFGSSPKPAGNSA